MGRGDPSHQNRKGLQGPNGRRNQATLGFLGAMPEPASSVIKCVVVGDGAVGKTCLLISYAQGSFPVDYVPTVFDNYAVQVPVGDRNITLNLFDTAGQEDYDRLRPMSYTNASVFLVCFSVASRSSFENVADKWVPELKKYAKGVPFILVGTQSDRRNGAPANRVVSPQEGIELAKRLGAVEYAECSAKTRDGLRDVFVGAIMTSTSAPPKGSAPDVPKRQSQKSRPPANNHKKKSGCSIF